MVRAEKSICPRSTPCRAQVGSAWCRLCQLSPNDRIASGQKLVALSPSRSSNGRSPTTWQIELIAQVTWCSSEIRTSPAQKNALSAPCQDQVTSPPARAGASSEVIVISGKNRSTRAMSLSASRSGANRARLDSSR